jgi:hypothetical protein
MTPDDFTRHKKEKAVRQAQGGMTSIEGLIMQIDFPTIQHVKDAESTRVQRRLRDALSIDRNMPKAVCAQFMNTLVMVRSPSEWRELERNITVELDYYDGIAAVKRRVKQARTHHKKTGRWPADYDPDTDLVENARQEC